MKKENNISENEKITITFNKKKVLKGVGVFLVVFAVLGLAFVVSKNSGKESKTFEFINITVDEYLEKMQGSEPSIIYVARPGCSWCQKESPIVKRLGSEYNLTIFYLNTDPFWDSTTNSPTETGQKFMDSSEEYAEGWGTPNTIIVGNGEIIDGIYKYAERSDLKDLFVRNGFINE